MDACAGAALASVTRWTHSSADTIHENLVYRSVMLGAAAYAVGAAIKSGNWDYGRPLLNPGRRQWRPPSGICSISSRSACECRDSMHSPPKLTSSAGPASLGFLKIGRGHLVNGDIFPPFPLIPHFAVARVPGRGMSGMRGMFLAGIPLRPAILVSV
jgi:hypothetical protein